MEGILAFANFNLVFTGYLFEIPTLCVVSWAVREVGYPQI